MEEEKEGINCSSDPPVPTKVSSSGVPRTFARDLESLPPSESECYECCVSCLGSCCGCMGAYVPCCCCCSNPYITVPQGSAGIVTKFGKAYKVVDPGLHFVNSMTEEMNLVSVKVVITDVPRQMVMTKDNVSVNIDSIVYWHIIDPFLARFKVADIADALKQRTMTTLRDTIGSYPLQTIIENRSVLNKEIYSIISNVAKSWGVVVEAILITDIQFSVELQETLSAAAKQERIGESKVISAKAEVQAAKLMREASDILSTTVAMELRYLDTLNNMARESNSKIIFVPSNVKS